MRAWVQQGVAMTKYKAPDPEATAFLAQEFDRQIAGRCLAELGCIRPKNRSFELQPNVAITFYADPGWF